MVFTTTLYQAKRGSILFQHSIKLKIQIIVLFSSYIFFHDLVNDAVVIHLLICSFVYMCRAVSEHLLHLLRD